uniref:Late embryogenesis abundant protein LEA-2 subgroup domain-containing protein n=2 Tax=Anthurium amnicola TaxID=1678845 RepID=A0A1D1Y2F7_9ARAE
MEERPPAKPKPVLQKPPGYRDPAAPRPAPPRPPPPRKQPLPPSFRPGSNNPKHYRRRPPRASCRRLCCWIFVALLVLLFALAVAGALSYLWFQPKLPSFHLVSVQNPQFAVTAKPDGSFLDARTVVRLQVANPNGKIGFFYAPMEARVAVPGDDDDGGEDVSLGSGYYPAFEQGKRNSTTVRFEARVKGVAVDDGLGRRLGSGFRSKSLRVLVEVRTKVGVVAGGKRSGKLAVRVLCGELSSRQVEGGASAKCTINLLKWINIH